MFRSIPRVAVLLLSVGILLGAPQATKAQGEPLLNQPRPAFTLPDLDGTPRSISEWDGKMLVINFWASCVYSPATALPRSGGAVHRRCTG